MQTPIHRCVRKVIWLLTTWMTPLVAPPSLAKKTSRLNDAPKTCRWREWTWIQTAVRALLSGMGRLPPASRAMPGVLPAWILPAIISPWRQKTSPFVIRGEVVPALQSGIMKQRWRNAHVVFMERPLRWPVALFNSRPAAITSLSGGRRWQHSLVWFPLPQGLWLCSLHKLWPFA